MKEAPPTESAGGTQPGQPSFASALERNIAVLRRRRKAEEANATREQRLADAITRFSGNMHFVYLHVLLVGAWVAINLGVVPGLPRFDPTFVILATWASVEAIFLSTFVLISQNRASSAAERRANLDLQISLLAEREITRVMRLTSAMADHLGVSVASDPELTELQRDVVPEAVLDAIEREDERPLRRGGASIEGE